MPLWAHYASVEDYSRIIIMPPEAYSSPFVYMYCSLQVGSHNQCLI